MNTTTQTQSLIVLPGQAITASSLGTFAASSSNPAYLIVNGYDRNEYTVRSSGATGSFSGNSNTLGFSALGGDARGAGIVFQYTAASGRYYNSTYGYLSQLTFTASTSIGDITDLSLFATNSASVANTYASNAISLARSAGVTYLGTLTVATDSSSRAVPTQATPLSIAAVAQTFVGSAWNIDGCWVLTSTISARAGASLPVQSAVNMAGAANGEWIVAYNGPAGSSGDWVSSVRTGDMVGFVTAAGTGHITTVVSGSGSSAMVVDNTAYVNAQGTIINSANDGSANDIIIQAAHSGLQEFAGVAASSVVIYRLDTPVVAAISASLRIAAGGTANLANVCTATDPAGKAITTFQAYSASAADSFIVNGASTTATSASNAVSASSLSQITFDRGTTAALDMITVRAFNGTYWGDWTTINVTDSVSVGQSALAAGDNLSIYRFFDTEDGTHFFTGSATEAATLQATRPDLSFEGVGLHGYATASASPTSEAVFRFFNVADGTHFYTASTSERDALVATQSSAMTFEGVAFYEDSAPRTGDAAVYRFFDTVHGTHLFTASASEVANIAATRSDLVSEGIAFYAPT